MNVRNLSGGFLWMMLVIIMVVVVSKLLGCGLGVCIGGMSLRELFLLGVGMVLWGEVGFIVVILGFIYNLID